MIRVVVRVGVRVGVRIGVRVRVKVGVRVGVGYMLTETEEWDFFIRVIVKNQRTNL